MAGLKCGTVGCEFETEDGTLDQKLKHLELHALLTHPANALPVQQQRQQGRPNKIETPKLKMGVGPDNFHFWKGRWDHYKRVNRLDDAQDIRDQLVNCETELYRDLHNTLGTSLQMKMEEELISEMRGLAVPHHSNLVSIVALRSATQERGERIRSYVARLRGLAGVSKLSLICTSLVCNEMVSFAEIEILNTMVKGLFDNETREEILSKSPELNLKTTIAFVEAKETAKRSAGVLTETSMASSQINKVTTQYKSEEKQVEETKEKCSYCGRTGHGKRAGLDKRKEVCKAYSLKCNKCSKVQPF